MNDLEMQRQEAIEDLRYRIMRTCSYGGELGATDKMILSVCRDIGAPVERESVRKQATYLEDKELVEVQKVSTEWRIKLTSFGLDVLEGNAQCPPGIRIPEV
jgi:hypothetical protein